MTVSGDIQLWGLGVSAASMATSALMSDRPNRAFAELDRKMALLGAYYPIQATACAACLKWTWFSESQHFHTLVSFYKNL